MNAALRRRHFRLWIALLLVLPLLVLLALGSRPEQPSQEPPPLVSPGAAR